MCPTRSLLRAEVCRALQTFMRVKKVSESRKADYDYLKQGLWDIITQNALCSDRVQRAKQQRRQLHKATEASAEARVSCSFHSMSSCSN